MEIIFQRDRNRAALFDGEKEVGEITFIDHGDHWVINHTFVEESCGGQGLAARLVDRMTEEASKAGVKLSATCSFAARTLAEDKI